VPGSVWSNTWTSITVSPLKCGEPDLLQRRGVLNDVYLKLNPVYNFKLLRANLRAKKNNESEIRLTPHSAQRQDNIAVANMHVGIQYLFNKLQPGVLFKQYDFGSPTDIHTYLTEMFQTHFQAQPTPAPDLNAGSLQWNDILTGNHADFQRRHSGLNIPLPTGDRQEALLAHCQSLRNVPNRHQVTADLQSLIQIPPSLEQFTVIIHLQNDHSSGGPSGLQFKHIQNWHYN